MSAASRRWPASSRVIRLASNESALGPSRARVSTPIARAPARSTAIPTAPRRACAQALGASPRPRFGAHRLRHRLGRAHQPAGRAPMPGRATRCSTAGTASSCIRSPRKAAGATPIAVPETEPDVRCRCGAGPGDGEDAPRLHRQPQQSRPAPSFTRDEMRRLHAGLPSSVRARHRRGLCGIRRSATTTSPASSWSTTPRMS